MIKEYNIVYFPCIAFFWLFHCNLHQVTRPDEFNLNSSVKYHLVFIKPFEMEDSENDDLDFTSRLEEIEALNAIYPGDIEIKEDEMIPLANGEWKLHKQRGAIMTIYLKDDDRTSSTSLSVRLDVLTPTDYPSRSAPTYR